MVFAIMVVTAFTCPVEWGTDTNLTAWCEQQHITVETIFAEFSVLDSILATEMQRKPYDYHLPTDNFGLTITEFGSLHHATLPSSALISDPNARIVFMPHPKNSEDDTCYTLCAYLFTTASETNMPMVQAVHCLDTGLRAYCYLTENGSLTINASGEVLLYANGKTFSVWPPFDPTDTMSATDAVTPSGFKHNGP